MATGSTRAGCTGVAEDSDAVAMTAPGGWRVVPICLERGGRVLGLYQVTRPCRAPVVRRRRALVQPTRPTVRQSPLGIPHR